MAAPVENAVLQWEDGYARVQEAARADGGAASARSAGIVIAVERRAAQAARVALLGRRAGRPVPRPGRRAARPRDGHDARRSAAGAMPRRHATPPSISTCARRRTSPAGRSGPPELGPPRPARGTAGIRVRSAPASARRIVIASASNGDGDGAVSRPVLRVHGVVRHRGIEPQAVALAAVVEGGLVGVARGRGGGARRGDRGAAAAAGAPSRRRRSSRRGRGASGSSSSSPGASTAYLRPPRRLPSPSSAATGRRDRPRRLRRRGRGPLTLGRLAPRPPSSSSSSSASSSSSERGSGGGTDRRIGRARAGALVAALEVVLALEAGQLVDRDVQLVGDPGVRAALAHPHADLVQLGAQGRLSSQIGAVG